MKGNPFKLTVSDDGSLRIRAKGVARKTIETEIKENYFEEKGIKNLDKLRPDGYKDGVWYEVKVGSKIMRGTDWIKCSEYFPDIYFPPYYAGIDIQIDSYINYGYCPLEVIVFDYDKKTIIQSKIFCERR